MLKEAIRLKLALEEEGAKGSTLYLRRPDGNHVELLFSY
jgi:hypothetical protein